MGVKLRALPKFSMVDNNGDPAVGYKIYTYEPGTTTNKSTFTDNARTATNTNPVILDARGEADIWWSGSYKVVVKDANDVLIYSVDNYGAGEDVAISGSYNLVGNSSFELDDDGDSLPDDWTITEYDATSTVILDTTDPNHGTSCLKFVSTGLGGGYAESALLEVSGAQDVFVGFDVKSSVVDVRNRVEIKWYDKDQILLSTTGVWDEAAANPTSWTTFKYTATSHASAKYARVVIYGCHNSDATAGETRFDDIRIVSITGTMMLQDSDAVDITGGNIEGLTLITTTNLFTTPPNTAGTSTAYTVTLGEVAYVVNRIYAAVIHTDNSGATATIDIDSLGAKTIKSSDGFTTVKMEAGQVAYFIYNGTDMILLNPAQQRTTQVFTSSGTFTPRGLTTVNVILVSGGGGGGGGGGWNGGAGGGYGGKGGNYGTGRMFSQTLTGGSTYTITINSGGAGGGGGTTSTPGSAGSTGGSVTFDGTTLTGGTGGAGGAAGSGSTGTAGSAGNDMPAHGVGGAGGTYPRGVGGAASGKSSGGGGGGGGDSVGSGATGGAGSPGLCIILYN